MEFTTNEEIMSRLIVEPMSEYHAKSKENLSSHKFSTFRDESPALFIAEERGEMEPFDTVAYANGRAAHTLILEGDEAYDSEYAVGGPTNPSTGKPYKRDSKKFADWCLLEDKDPGMVLTLEDDEMCQAMKKSCDNNPDIVEILSKGVSERVIRAKYNDLIPCQIRPDWYRHGAIYDLKTCNDLNWFIYDAVKKFKYISNAAFYRTVFLSAFPNAEEIDYYFIAVEKKVPYRSGVFLCDRSLLDSYEEKNDLEIEKLIECRKTNVWPSNFEGVKTIEDWKRKD